MTTFHVPRAASSFDQRARTAEGAAPGAIGFADLLGRIDDDAARGEIGPLHEGEQLVSVRLRICDQVEGRIAKLGHVVGWDRTSHATAMPVAPFASRFGNAAGRTMGSFWSPE